MARIKNGGTDTSKTAMESIPTAVIETNESDVSKAGAKYSYPLEMASKAARLNKRDEREVLEQALDELSLVPELAAESYYSIPRKRKTADGGTEVIKIEGPSIGAAMALASRWGNSINGSHVREELDDRIVCEGVFIDAQRNFWTFRTVAAEKFITDRATKLKRPMPQDMLLNAIQAAQSKAVRNAILASLPKWLVRAYFNEAKRIASGGTPRGAKKPDMTAKDRLEWLYKHFPKMGVTVEMLDAYSKENFSDETLEEQVGTLVGIYTAIKDQQTTVEEVFGKKNAPTQQPGQGPVSAGDLLKEKSGG